MDFNKVLFKVTSLRRTYGEGNGQVVALDNEDFEIYEGELLCILGCSGSGKTTLLNLIAGMDRANAGEIYYKKDNICKFNNKQLTLFRRHEIGFVFQFFNLLDELTVYQNVTITPGSNKNKKEVVQLLDTLGIKDKLNNFPAELSGGEQQRVSIARALNKNSNVIVCDEPTGALDYNSGKKILELLEKIHESNQKKTIIIVTHTKEIAKMCDRVIMLKNGKIIGDVINFKKIKAQEVNW